MIKITAHCLVRNEENFIWFAIMSILDMVDRIIVWDTGSSDSTVSIIKTINSPKIEFAQKGEQDSSGIANLRQQMIKQTDSEWIMILDGDEIWWENSLHLIKQSLENAKFDIIVSPVYMLVGDIFHYQEEKAGKYKIGNKEGHYNIRFIRNMENLHIEGYYPDESYVTKEGIKAQDLPSHRLFFSEDKYLHASHLKRTSKSNKKQKYEIGNSFPLDFYYPEALFLPRPSIVSSPWQTLSKSENLIAMIQTPLRKIKRSIYA